MAGDKILRYLEVAEQTSFEVDDASLPAQGTGVYINMASSSLDTPGETNIEVPSAFGRAADEFEPGFYSPSGNVVYPVNIRTIVNFLKWGLGGYAFMAGAPADATAGTPAGLNIHEAWGDDTRILPPVLVRVGKDQFEDAFRSMVVESMELSVEDALTNLTIEFAGQRNFRAVLQAKNAVKQALPTERKIPFHQVNVSIDGVLQQRKMKTLTLSIGNSTDAESGRYLGTRFPGRVPANERSTTLSTEMDFSDLTQLQRIWGDPDGATESSRAAEFPVEIEFNGGKNADSLDQLLLVTLPKVHYQTVETQPSGREEMTQPVTMIGYQGDVTLDDGATVVTTDVYTKTANEAPMVEAVTAA